MVNTFIDLVMGRKHPGTSGGAQYLKGLEKVMANLNVQLDKVEGASMAGLIKAAAHVRQETEKPGNVLTPVDKGNLRASWFVVTKDKVPVGYGSKQFDGEKAAEFLLDHETNLTQAQGEVRTMSTNDKEFLMMGYTMNYAGFVHEMVGVPPENWSRLGSGDKWLERAIANSTGKIVEIVRENAIIKK
jgi:hypothetical protein